MPALSGLGDPPERLKLERLNAAVDWDIFRPEREWEARFRQEEGREQG